MNDGISIVDKWYLDRWTRFTASEMYKIMPGGIAVPGSMFSKAGNTYIETKVMEMETVMHERPELEDFKNFLHGRVHERPAFERYVRATRNTSLRYLGSENPLFFTYGDAAGGSPDAIMGEDVKIVFGVEFKNPINPLVHSRNRRLKDQYELKSKIPKDYGQCQTLIKMFGADQWDWVSHDERQVTDAGKIKIIQVYPDKPYLSSMEVRLRQAIKERNRLYSESNS